MKPKYYTLQQKSTIEPRWTDWIVFAIKEDAIHELTSRQTYYPHLMWRIKPTQTQTPPQKNEPK
jgi:hypothetical protein